MRFPIVGSILAKAPIRGGTAVMAGAAFALMVTASATPASDVEACRALRQQRDALATRAMEQELALVRVYRSRICPRLALQAEGANARDQQFTTINYTAWNACRVKAERQLEARETLRYRNDQGFTFFTSAGAQLASQADQLSRRWSAQGCQ